MRLADYEQLGGVGGSLRNRANEVFRTPSPAQRVTMRRVMLRMVSIEGGELARRRVPRAELEYGDPAENTRIAEVLRRLTGARLLVEGSEGGHPYVEPAHDELVRGWSRLLRWSRKAQEEIYLRRLLTPAALDWSQRGGGLWHANPRLTLLKRVAETGETRNRKTTLPNETSCRK